MADKPSEKKSSKGLPPKHRSPMVLLRRYLPQVVHRPIIRSFRKVVTLWKVNSGDWKWLEGKPISLTALNRNLWRSANPSSSYFILIFLSGVISTMGLLAGSTATIIGAMIVAPLMGPIMGIAFALSIGNRRLLKRSSLALFLGCVLTVTTAYLLTLLIDLDAFNAEITSRISPTLMDLIIALAAGAAGAFAQTRREVADAIPGVAIAVALIPPLSVIGIGLALPSGSVALGSTVLFLTNLASIIFSGALVFVWQKYGSLVRAKGGLLVTILTLCGLAIPLIFSLRDLVIEAETRSLVSNLIRRQTVTFGNTNIRTLRVESVSRQLKVDLEVAAPEASISDRQVQLVREFLEDELRRPIDLTVWVIPIEILESSSPADVVISP